MPAFLTHRVYSGGLLYMLLVNFAQVGVAYRCYDQVTVDETTAWGAVRVRNDSHPAPFDLRFFELGNEQQNPQFVQQVVEMEMRRKAVGEGTQIPHPTPRLRNCMHILRKP